MRAKGPLTQTSAFKFEIFYSGLRNSLVPGTKSTLKQMVQNTVLKQKLSPHFCKQSLYISDHDTALECNTLVYTYNGSCEFYKIISIHDDTVICNPQGKNPCTFMETSNLNWSLIGVFLKGGISSKKVKLQTH